MAWWIWMLLGAALTGGGYYAWKRWGSKLLARIKGGSGTTTAEAGMSITTALPDDDEGV